ncbi:unnamed protein product [Symbiodinium sp. CCMP2592]|nr:unnamed protein product [Symbiodinium sp. CCMP2592]
MPTGPSQCSGGRVQQQQDIAQTGSLVTSRNRWSTVSPSDGHEPGAQRARKGFPALHTVRMPR